MNKIIGFQTIHNSTKNIHPKMSASFCVYSLSQCMAMLKCASQEERDLYTIETVRDGDIEEPTMMFKGNPTTAGINKLIHTKKTEWTCRIQWKDNGEQHSYVFATNETKLNDDDVFFYVESFDELKSIKENNSEDFIILEIGE